MKLHEGNTAADHKLLSDWILKNLPHEIGRGGYGSAGESAAEVAIRLLKPLADTVAAATKASHCEDHDGA